MMKVLYLMDNLNVGGAERSLLEITSRFKKTEAVMCRLFEGGALDESYIKAGVRVVPLGAKSGMAGVPGAIWRAVRLIKSVGPDIVEGTGFYSRFVARVAGRLAGVTVMESFINEDFTPLHYEATPQGSRRRLRLAHRAYRATSRFVTHVDAISDSVRDTNCITLGIPPEKVTVIYRGRDPEPYINTNADEVRRLRDALYVPEGTGVALNVARLLKRKGQEELIRAMPDVHALHPGVVLLIAGEGPHRPVLEALIKELGLGVIVRLLGHVDNIPALYKISDMLVFPSHYEGLGGSIIEAMFSALPVVAADTPVHRETVGHGETGLLVPVRDPDALAGGISWILEHPEEAADMGKKGRHTAMQRFHIDKIAAEHEALFEKVMGEVDGR